MVALPVHMAAAMENWGLVLYHQSYLLLEKEEVKEQKQKKMIAGVIAHETAHQWFGNLVTMEWWSDVWLNEGLATYMQNLGFRRSFPELSESEEAVREASMFVRVDCCSPGLNGRFTSMSYAGNGEPKWSDLLTLASDESSYDYELLTEYCYHHAVSSSIHFSAADFQSDILSAMVVSKYFAARASRRSATSKQNLLNFCSRARINSRATFFSANCQIEPDSQNTVKKNVSTSTYNMFSVFDSFAYKKGSIIAGMVHHILGEKLFWKFIRVYLKEKAYGNVDESDFWRYAARAQFFTKSPKIDMKTMASWTHHPGMPIVTVTRDYLRREAKLSQSSCIGKGKHTSDLWPIPITYITQTTSSRKSVIREWLTGKSVTLRNMPAEDQWILLNDEGAYYYVVDYDQRNWKLLTNQLKQNHLVFTTRQRYKILSDAHHLYLMKPRNDSNELLLELCSYLHKERSWFVFKEPNHNFILSAFPLMIHSTAGELWKEYFQYIFLHVYDKFADGSRPTPIRMSLLEHAMCFFEYSPCVKKRLAEFQEWKNHMENFPEGSILQLREMLCVAVRQSSENAWYLYKMFENYTEAIYLEALLCTSDDSVMNRLMDKFAKKDPEMLLIHGAALITNRRHWTKIFDHIEKHFQSFADEYFIKILDLFEYNSSPAFTEKVMKFAKKYIPKLQGDKKKAFREMLERRKLSLKKFKPIVSSIEGWLRRKPWELQFD